MKTRSATGVVGAALWLAVTAAAVARASEAPDPEAGFAETIDVELVNVDVWVTGRGGDPATGLTAADFEILHDGRPVPIAHFTEIRGGSEYRRPSGQEPAADAAAGTAERDPTAFFPGHVVIYFDQSRLHPRNSKALARDLQELLDAGEVAPERVMVVRQERSLFVEAPFGSSKKELEAALAGLAKGAGAGLDLETETQQALQAIRSTWDQIQDSVGSAQSGLASLPSGGQPGDPSGGSPRSVVGGVGSGAGPDACGPLFHQIGPILDGFTRSQGRRIAVTLANLSDTASFLAGLPGIKVLLYLSDGLDTRPGAALASYAGSLCPARSGDLLGSVSSLELSTPFMELTRHANANRVTIYALQATGLRSPGAGSAKSERGVRRGGFGARSAFESTQRSGEREGLRLLADQTGGRTIFNRNDLGPELTKIGRDLGTYYSLAYQPPAGGEGEAGRGHRIEVRLRDDSLSARYRRGYLDKDADQWLAERIEGALNLGITSNPLEVRLGAGDVRPGDGGTFKLPLHVMVPVERLAFRSRDGSYVAEVTVRAMARSFTSSILAIRDQTFRIQGAPGATGWANLTLEIELGEGAHATAVGVRDETTGEASYVATTLQTGS